VKKAFLFCSCVLILVNTLYAQSKFVSLNEGILTSATEIAGHLASGTTVIVDVNSSIKSNSEVVKRELIRALGMKNIGNVDRDYDEQIINEIRFQELEASRESRQYLGQATGATAMVLGEIIDMKSYYRISFRTIMLESRARYETAAIDTKDKLLIRQRESFGPAAHGFMNLAFGLGSYLQGDTPAGLIITGGYALSAALIIYELRGLSVEDSLAGIPGYVGIGLAGATAIFGFVKPYIYDKNNRVAYLMDRVNIVAVSNKQGINGFGISYKYSF
jgi:hypothetical protein